MEQVLQEHRQNQTGHLPGLDQIQFDQTQIVLL